MKWTLRTTSPAPIKSARPRLQLFARRPVYMQFARTGDYFSTTFFIVYEIPRVLVIIPPKTQSRTKMSRSLSGNESPCCTSHVVEPQITTGMWCCLRISTRDTRRTSRSQTTISNSTNRLVDMLNCRRWMTRVASRLPQVEYPR